MNSFAALVGHFCCITSALSKPYHAHEPSLLALFPAPAVVFVTVGFKTKDDQTHLAILREYVSKEAEGHGKTLLEKLGLKERQIRKHYGGNPQNEEQAIQDGLLAWVGMEDPTWEDLLKAMEAMKDTIGIQASKDLKAKLCQ